MIYRGILILLIYIKRSFRRQKNPIRPDCFRYGGNSRTFNSHLNSINVNNAEYPTGKQGSESISSRELKHKVQ